MFTGLLRTIILYILIIAGVRLMGKRQVGELEPSELVLSLIIADLASVPMQDYGIPLPPGENAIFCIRRTFRPLKAPVIICKEAGGAGISNINV